MAAGLRVGACALAVVTAVAGLTISTRVLAQLSGTFPRWLDHPAINYKTEATSDPVAMLNRELDHGRVLSFAGPSGYLRATLDALKVPIESQIAVFVQDSAQAPRISESNPRTIFFNDSVAVGWVRGGFIELAAQDPRQGVVFYMLETNSVASPRFQRRDACLACHLSYPTLGVPGMLARSSGQFSVNHTLPIDQRWGGWYVTSKTAAHHRGNVPLDRLALPAPLSPPVASFADRFDTHGYLSTQSDVVALMVFDHQMHGLNLLTRIGWEARVAAYDGAAANGADTPPVSMADAAREVVDYLLFVDEAPLPERIEGTSDSPRGSPPRDRAIGADDRCGNSI